MNLKDENTGDIESLYKRAVTFHQGQQFENARNCYLKLLEALPDNSDLLHLCGLASYQLGDADDAKIKIRAAIELKAENGDYHSNLGLALKSLGEYKEAIRSFRRALDLNPNSPDFLNNLGNAYVADGQPDEAEEIFRRSIATHPERADSRNNLAVLLAAEKQETEALQLYESALQLQPNYTDARMNLWRLLMRMERYDDAIAQQKIVLDNDDQNAVGHRDLGEALQKTGRSREALVACERALSLRQDDANCHVTIGNVLQSLDKTAEAEAHYRQALEIDPCNARAKNNIGTLLMAAGNTDEALDFFTAAADQDAEFTAAFFNQGSALASLGRVDEAIEKFSAVIRLKPEMEKAYRYLAELYRAKKLYSDEEQILKQWIALSPDSPTAKHLLTALGEGSAPVRAPDEFICEEFDEFADTFEETLEQLNYKTPEFIGRLLTEQLAPSDRTLSVLDAGCGTGLCAPFLRPMSKYLAGVDLSSNMISVAAKKEMYDELVTAELLEYMSAGKSQFDVVVSADTLVYFGRLEEVILAAANALKSGGAIAFSLEYLEDDQAGEFRLNPSGRYCHSADYVVRCMEQAGFEIDVLEYATLRTEMRSPVRGLLVLGHLTESAQSQT